MRALTLPALTPGSAVRFVAWLTLFMFLSVTFYEASWVMMLDTLLNPTQVLDDHLVHRWGVLGLCFFGLFLKRSAISEDAQGSLHPGFAVSGLATMVLSTSLLSPAPLFAGAVGAFALFFGKGARWPMYMLGVYLLAVYLPLFIEAVALEPLGTMTATPATELLQAFGYSIERSGNMVAVIASPQNSFWVEITAACAGPATWGVFLALFALMAVDLPLPKWQAAALLVVGIIGTWIQNLIRIMTLLLIGYYQGEPAMWMAHSESGYITFILWYAVFGVLYVMVVRNSSAITNATQRLLGRS